MAKKKSTKINFLGQETAGWGGGLSTRRGGGPKVRALPRKFVLQTLGFEGGKPWDVPRILSGMSSGPLGVFKKFCVQKKFVRIVSFF